MTGEARASARVVRIYDETFAPPVIEVCLDGDDEGTVAQPSAACLIVRQDETLAKRRLLTTAARHRTTPVTLDIPADRSSRSPVLQETLGVSHREKARG